MKVLLTSDHNMSAVNGVVVAIKNLKEELIKHGAEVRLLVLSPTMNSYVEDDTYYVGSMPLNIYPDVRATTPIPTPQMKELVDWKPDIIHSQCEFFTYSFVNYIAGKCNCPIVHTYHTMYEHYVRYVFPVGNWGKIVAPIMRFRLNTADVVIAPTMKTAGILQKENIAKDIRVIPTGIRLSKYDRRITQEEKAKLRKKLRIPDDAHVFGSVGRLAKEKNYDEVLDALKALTAERKDVVLVLVGDGAYREELENRVQSEGLHEYVRFTGMVDPEKIAAYYQLFDFFVSASISETQGLTYIEALANGIPVIARRDDAIKTVIIDDQNGYQFDTTEELIAQAKELFDHSDKRCRLQKGAEACRDKYSTETFGDRVLNLYKEVINRSTPPRLQQVRLSNQLTRHIKLRTERSDYGQFYSVFRSKIQRRLYEKKRTRSNHTSKQ